MSHDNPAQLQTTHPQVLELCIVLGKCLRGIAFVTHPHNVFIILIIIIGFLAAVALPPNS